MLSNYWENPVVRCFHIGMIQDQNIFRTLKVYKLLSIVAGGNLEDIAEVLVTAGERRSTIHRRIQRAIEKGVSQGIFKWTRKFNLYLLLFCAFSKLRNYYDVYFIITWGLHFQYNLRFLHHLLFILQNTLTTIIR